MERTTGVCVDLEWEWERRRKNYCWEKDKQLQTDVAAVPFAYDELLNMAHNNAGWAKESCQSHQWLLSYA